MKRFFVEGKEGTERKLYYTNVVVLSGLQKIEERERDAAETTSASTHTDERM